MTSLLIPPHSGRNIGPHQDKYFYLSSISPLFALRKANLPERYTISFHLSFDF